MIAELTAEGARSIAGRLRPHDLELMRKLSYHDDVDLYCASRIELDGPKWMISHDGIVEVIGGLHITCPGTVTAWIVATQGWERHKFEAVRYMKRVIDAAIRSGAAKRVQAWVLASNVGANRMAQTVGFDLEATMKAMADGEDINLYARTWRSE
jgi:hypothetical protein